MRPTSALDPVTEKRIDDNLRPRLHLRHRAHRLSTIRDCDEIIRVGNPPLGGRVNRS